MGLILCLVCMGPTTPRASGERVEEHPIKQRSTAGICIEFCYVRVYNPSLSPLSPPSTPSPNPTARPQPSHPILRLTLAFQSPESIHARRRELCYAHGWNIN